MTAALGFRVRSGWASTVLVGGPRQEPELLDRRAIELFDPRAPETRQPYHAASGTLEEDASVLKLRIDVIHGVAQAAARGLLRDYAERGVTVRRAGLVAGSLTDPASITHPHVRAHALEGRLSWSVLKDALGVEGVACSVVAEKDAYRQAAIVLARPEAELRRLVAALGKGAMGPWRAEEKVAAVWAWAELGG